MIYTKKLELENEISDLKKRRKALTRRPAQCKHTQIHTDTHTDLIRVKKCKVK